tara:strand:+ start:144 stop:431 length:288 start_codon:yes stop_codon:yes gene_type:complete
MNYLDKNTIYVRWANADIRSFVDEIGGDQLKISLDYNKEIRDYEHNVMLNGKFLTVAQDMIEAHVPEGADWRDVWEETAMAEKTRIYEEFQTERV